MCNIKPYEVILSGVTKTLEKIGNRLCKSGNLSGEQIKTYDDFQQRLSDISKTIADMKASDYVPDELYTQLGIELGALHTDIKLFATKCR